MTVRAADKAGSWYPAAPERLAADLDAYLAPGPVEVPPGTVAAAIVPHAGLAYSGPTAGKSFAALQRNAPETLLLFGAVHTMPLERPAIWMDGAWETPLGPVPVDTELAKALCEAGVGEPNPAPHQGDNALELQMPFVRHCFPEARIVPIAVPPEFGIEACGAQAWEVVQVADRQVAVVGSTDLTHYGVSFAFTPQGTGPKALAWAKENDQRFLDLMLAGNAEAMVKQAIAEHSACGAGAAAATVAYARAAGARGVLLEHTTSHDAMPNGEALHFVGYASLVFVQA